MTPLYKAAQAASLVDEFGYSVNQTAEILGIGKSTVYNILNGGEGWEGRQPVVSQYWAKEKARLQHAMTELAKESLVHASETLDKASYLQAVTGTGILIDKVRLLSGEPTEIHANVNLNATVDLDQLASRLGTALVNRKPNT